MKTNKRSSPKKRTTASKPPSRSQRTKTIRHDIAAQLRTPKEMAAYLEAWLADAPEDSTGISRALGDIARARGMSKVARDSGLSRESLYRALSANGNPSLSTIIRVLDALGIRLHASAA